MKTFRFGDMLRAVYPNDPEAPGTKQAALYIVARGGELGDYPFLVSVNPIARLKGADPETIVEQNEVFAMESLTMRCVTVEGFALGFDEVK